MLPMETRRECLEMGVHNKFALTPDSEVWNSRTNTLNLTKLADKYAPGVGGVKSYQKTIHRAWKKLVSEVKKKAPEVADQTEEVYLKCLEYLEPPVTGNPEFHYEAALPRGEMDIIAATCDTYAKLGFPLAHEQVQELVQRVARRLLQEEVASFKREDFIDLPSNREYKKTGRMGDLPPCGKTWFRKCVVHISCRLVIRYTHL